MVCLGFKFWAWSLIFPHQTLLYSDDTIHIKQLYAVTKKYPTNRLTILFLDLLQVLKKSTTTPCSAIGMAPSLLNRTLKWCQSPINDISGIDWITILEDLEGSNDIGSTHVQLWWWNPMKWFDQCNYRILSEARWICVASKWASLCPQWPLWVSSKFCWFYSTLYSG